MEQQLIDYIEKTLLYDEEKVAVEDDLLTSGLLDSIKIMQLVNHVSNAFGITIPPEDMVIEHFISVSAITTYVAGRQTQAS